MLSKIEILETIRSKGRGKAIQINTHQDTYWGRLYELKGEVIVLRPYYTSAADQLPLHDIQKEILIDEIINIL